MLERYAKRASKSFCFHEVFALFSSHPSNFMHFYSIPHACHASAAQLQIIE
jgi:hypothetical protein